MPLAYTQVLAKLIHHDVTTNDLVLESQGRILIRELLKNSEDPCRFLEIDSITLPNYPVVIYYHQ